MPSGTPGPVVLCRVEVVRRSGLGGSGEGRGLPYVHPQHMEGMKLHPPEPSRVRAQRYREGLAKCVALAERWESGKAVGSDSLGRVIY